jgi:acetolactate synthase-1/2/3 large subunit
VNGAEALMRTLAGAGVELCLANPGTTEIHLVEALDAAGLRGVLGLFEGVCTGAADGYGRMADKPALVVLHLGPGFANGAANLHNARRARTPLLCLVGDHATWHASADAPLQTDLPGLARPVSDWVYTSKCAEELPRDGARALCAAGLGAVATLIVPADCAWGEAEGPLPVAPPRLRGASVDAARVEAVARALGRARPAALLLGGRGLRRPGLEAAARIAAASGCTLLGETFPTRMERGAGFPAVAKLPYFPEDARALLSRFETLVLAGTPSPVAFFGYPDQPSSLVPPACDALLLAEPGEDVERALEAVADSFGVGCVGDPPRPLHPPPLPSGPLDAAGLGAAVASVQPEGAIVVDEGLTSALPWTLASVGAPPHTLLSLTGGAIGQGLPCATGAALACPDRPVIALQADGSGLYTLQSLWTQAHEGLQVTTVVCANRGYRILRIELARAGIVQPGPNALGLTGFPQPAPDWVALGRGFGVPGERVETAESLRRALLRALGEPGPHLIEAVLDGPVD